MTRKKLDGIIDEMLAAIAQGQDLNTIPEQKGGDLGEVMQMLGTVLRKFGDDIVYRTRPNKTVTVFGHEVGPHEATPTPAYEG